MSVMIEDIRATEAVYKSISKLDTILNLGKYFENQIIVLCYLFLAHFITNCITKLYYNLKFILL
jgi:hypothetical protein